MASSACGHLKIFPKSAFGLLCPREVTWGALWRQLGLHEKRKIKVPLSPWWEGAGIVGAGSPGPFPAIGQEGEDWNTEFNRIKSSLLWERLSPGTHFPEHSPSMGMLNISWASQPVPAGLCMEDFQSRIWILLPAHSWSVPLRFKNQIHWERQ